jgi:hypothetical protein
VLVEQIFPQIVLAGAQLKTLWRQKREMQALLDADRAVAGGYGGESVVHSNRTMPQWQPPV